MLQFHRAHGPDIVFIHHVLSDTHIQIPPTSYIGLILRSTTVDTASCSTVDGI